MTAAETKNSQPLISTPLKPSSLVGAVMSWIVDTSREFRVTQSKVDACSNRF